MKRVILILAAGLFAGLFLLSGCAGNGYTFTKAAERVDLFKVIADNGGVSTLLKVNRDGSGELTAAFSNVNTPVEDWVRDLNENALGKDRYRDGERVVESKSVKVKLGLKYATLYFRDARHLNNPEFDVMPVSYYLKHYDQDADSILFTDRSGKAVSLRNLKGDDAVLVLSGYADNMEIRVDGRILAASEGMISEAYKSNSIRYANTSCVVAFGASHTWVVIGVVAGVVVLLGIVFLILVKCRVFTALKLKSARNKKG